jgi:general secretion pathway protein E
MSLANHLISATLRLSIAQRLVRTLCRACGGKGCSSCSGKGLKGRTGVFELFKIDAKASRLIADGASEEAILNSAVESGFVSLSLSAREKVLSGVITEAQAMRIES